MKKIILLIGLMVFMANISMIAQNGRSDEDRTELRKERKFKKGERAAKLDKRQRYRNAKERKGNRKAFKKRSDRKVKGKKGHRKFKQKRKMRENRKFENRERGDRHRSKDFQKKRRPQRER